VEAVIGEPSQIDCVTITDWFEPPFDILMSIAKAIVLDSALYVVSLPARSLHKKHPK